MEQKYIDWIKANVTETYGKCVEVSQAMVEAFPELTRVRGWYDCPIWGEREHWWLSDGNRIIDPTARQFPTKGDGTYVELPPDYEEPIGRCMECGDLAFQSRGGSSHACGPEHQSVLEAAFS